MPKVNFYARQKPSVLRFKNKRYNCMPKKVVLITGASSGIGRATAVLFARKGVRVVAVGRNEKKLKILRDEIRRKDGAVETQIADLSDTAQSEKVVNETIKNFGQIDVLVNGAGIILNGTIENTSLDDWDKMMNVNLRALFFMMQKCVPHLEKTKGTVVNISSVAGTRSFPNVLAYCVSKAALDQLTRCSALELAAKGIRVNAVNPGVCGNKFTRARRNVR